MQRVTVADAAKAKASTSSTPRSFGQQEHRHPPLRQQVEGRAAYCNIGAEAAILLPSTSSENVIAVRKQQLKEGLYATLCGRPETARSRSDDIAGSQSLPWRTRTVHRKRIELRRTPDRRPGWRRFLRGSREPIKYFQVSIEKQSARWART